MTEIVSLFTPAKISKSSKLNVTVKKFLSKDTNLIYFTFSRDTKRKRYRAKNSDV